MKPSRDRSPRLYVDATLKPGVLIGVGKAQIHYLTNVMRRKPKDRVRIFNGRDGEWLCTIEDIGKQGCVLKATEQTRKQAPTFNLHYLFAPLKHSRLDYVTQKATELGASCLRPVVTAHTNVARIKTQRMRANAIEAAEQCNLLAIPEVCEPVSLDEILAGWDDNRQLVFCDEYSAPTSPLAALEAMERGPLAVMIGPEGGFSEEERTQILNLAFVTAISLGPRIMRADTAGVAALALVQATLGDWG